MRSTTATNPQITRTQISRLCGEIAYFEAVAGKGVKGRRKWHFGWQIIAIWIAQGLERGLVIMGAVGHRQSSDMAIY
jgi:hypothetical protein